MKKYLIVFLLIATLVYTQNIGGMLSLNQTWTGTNIFTALVTMNTISAASGAFSVDSSGNVIANSLTLNGSGPGTVQTAVGTYSVINAATPCNSTNEATRAGFQDSTTATFGSTIAGGGSNHVPGYCNGTNWVVE
jgi:hypothetical protein